MHYDVLRNIIYKNQNYCTIESTVQWVNYVVVSKMNTKTAMRINYL